MIKLINLEIKKFKLMKYWKGVLGANLGFIIFIGMVYFLNKVEEEIPFDNFEMASTIISAVVSATFIIFASVILANLVIDEYKNKSIDLMFTYPISRKKIMSAKLIIVMVFTFMTVLFSTLFLQALVYIMDVTFDILPGDISIQELINSVWKSFFIAFAAAGLSLIPLLIGMLRKSSSATIVSSIFLVTLTSSVSNNFTFSSVMTVSISLALLGIIIGWLSIRNVEKTDL
ncbi:MAG: ABC transporter permease [Psychrobacillus psychrotolerans]|uniref:ABC transporter permease n=1 Tax=Psychrobacillus psychrotolerans TaxID=126156 RepID=UPI003BAE6768